MKENKPEILISVVSPVYRGEVLVSKLVEQIINSVSLITDNFEIILVEDGSPDKSWAAIEDECKLNTKVKGIKLSRNFGQHYAITSGLRKAKGDWIVVMDCDLQDKPSEIPNLFEKTKEGYEIVLAQRIDRSDTFLKRLSSKLFYKLFSYLTDTKQDDSVANFGVYSRNVVNSILDMGDYYRYFPTMVQWVGYSKSYVPVHHQERDSGGSSYSFRKLLTLAFDNIIAFSDKPLRLTIRIGVIVLLTALVFGMYNIYKFFTGEITELGYASIILSIWFLAGVIILLLGIIGVYLGKTFETLKQRPTFITEKELNCDE